MHAERDPVLEYFGAATATEGDGKKASMLYSALPAVVQDRIPAFPSLRRAVSHMRSSSTPLNASRNTSESSLPQTPPPGYTSKRDSPVGSSPSSPRTPFASNEDPFQEAHSAPRVPVTLTPPLQEETRTGIQWKYAGHGVSLSMLAHADSTSPYLDDASVGLTRQMYIHGLMYLLRGLPSTLSPEETLALQSALPSALFIQAPCNHDLAFPQRDTSSPPSDPSLLHRITAIIIFESFVLLQFLLPYIKAFIAAAYQFERKHNVTQRLVNNGLVTAGAMRRTGVQLTHTICQMNDGKVGQALNYVILWWVRGITGGLQQGIQDGVVMMGEGRGRTGRRERIERKAD